MTADTLLAFDEEDVGINDEPCALIVLDRGTDYLDAFPLKDKTADSHLKALLEFAGPNYYINELYTANSLELIKAAADAKWIHSTSTPERPDTNGVAERSVRSVKQGARTTLLRSGLGLCIRFWVLGIQHWCFARNTRTKSANGDCLPFGTTDNAYTRRRKNTRSKASASLLEL